jgi:hypothetical protein
MNDQPREALGELIARYGPGLADDPRRCEAMLRDHAGEYRREVSALVVALREGVPGDLQRTPGGVPPETRLAALATRLADQSGLDRDLARWAVESWALALGIIPAPLIIPRPATPPPPSHPMPDPAQVGSPWPPRPGVTPIIPVPQPAPVPFYPSPPRPQAAHVAQYHPPARQWTRVSSTFTLTGHKGPVAAVAINSDGRLLASGSKDQTVKLWDLTTGQLIRTLGGHSRTIRSVAFTPDGQLLAAGDRAGEVKIWNIHTGELIGTLKQRGAIFTVAISPDGQLVASAGEDKGIRLWELQSVEHIRTLRSDTEDINALVFTPDGQTLISGSGVGMIRLWNIATGDLRRSFPRLPAVFCFALSVDGQLVAIGGKGKKINLRDAWTGEVLGHLEDTGRMPYVYTVAISPDKQLLASGGEAATVQLWDLQTKELIARLPGHSDFVFSIAFSPDGRLLASGSGDATIRIWAPM